MKKNIRIKEEQKALIEYVNYSLSTYGRPECLFQNDPIVAEALNHYYYDCYHMNHPSYSQYHIKMCMSYLELMNQKLDSTSLSEVERSQMQQIVDVVTTYVVQDISKKVRMMK